MDGISIGTIIIQPTRDDAEMQAQGFLPMMGGGVPYFKAVYSDLWTKIQGTQWIAEDLGASFRLRDLSNQFIRGYAPGNGLLTFPFSMADLDYYFTAYSDSKEITGSSIQAKINSRTATGWTVFTRTGGGNAQNFPYTWEVKGYAADLKSQVMHDAKSRQK